MKSAMQKSPKRRKITDFFQKQTPTTEWQQQPETEPQQQVMPAFLTRYRPTSVPRHKGPVGRFRKHSQSLSDSTEAQPGSSQEPEEAGIKKPRGVYKSFSLHQNLEIVKFARENSEHAASRRYGVSWSTIFGWKDIDKEPATKKKVPTITKGKHTKKGAGRHLSYSQEIDEELLSWVLHQRDLHIGVRRQDIQFKAKALISERHLDFKVSSGWMDKFMCRHSLSVR